MSAHSVACRDSLCLNANPNWWSCRDMVRSGHLFLSSPVAQPRPVATRRSRCSGREWHSKTPVALTFGSPAMFHRMN